MKKLSAERNAAMFTHLGPGVQTRAAAQEEGYVRPSDDDAPSLKLSTEAMLCLHTAAEEFMKGLMFDSSVYAVHAKRVTVMPQDIRLAARPAFERRYQIGRILPEAPAPKRRRKAQQ